MAESGIKRDICVFTVYLLLSLFSLRSIFVTSDPVAFGDLAPMDRLEQLYRPFDFPWDYKSNLGSPVMLIGNMIYNLPLISLSLIFGSVALAHKILLLLLMASAAFGFYLAFKYFMSSRTAGFVAGLSAMFNPFTLFRWTHGHNTILLAYVFLPLMLLSYFKVLRDGGRLSTISCGLLLAVTSAVSPHLGYLAGIIIVLHGLLDALLCKGGGLAGSMSIRLTQLVFVFALALSALAPLLFHISMVNLPVLMVRAEEAVAGSTIVSIVSENAIYLTFVAATIGLAFLLNLRRLRGSELIFALLAYLGILLFLSAARPLSPLYIWLFDNVPGFSLFRETNRFLLLTVVSMSYFTGLLAESLKNLLHRVPLRIKYSLRVRRALPILVLGLVIMLPWSQFFTGDMNGHVQTVRVSGEYQELYEWLSSQEGDFRIAFFPPAVWATTYSWAPARFLDPLVALQAKPTVELKSELDVTSSASFVRWVYATLYANRTSEWGKLLGLLGVKYVVLRMDADMPTDRFDLRAFALSRTLKAWANQRGLVFIGELGSLLIYENPRCLPRVFEAGSFSLLVGDRRALVSLNYLNFSFGEAPGVFLDDNIGSADFVVRNARYLVFQGDPYWSMISSMLGEDYIIRSWDYASTSMNPLDKWIRGDAAWYFYGGDMNVASDGYIYTEGGNVIDIPIEAGKHDTYNLLVQVYSGLPSSGGLRFRVIPDIDFTYLPRRGLEGSYVWVNVGSLELNGEGKTLSISSLGGSAAISKIVLVPESLVADLEQRALNMLRASAAQIIYLLDDYSWNPCRRQDTLTFVENSGASNGRLTSLAESGVGVEFYVFREGNYTLMLRLANPQRGSRLRVSMDGNVTLVDVLPKPGTAFLDCGLGPFYLRPGSHSLKIEADGGSVMLDLAILATALSGFETTETTAASVDYTMWSGSEYEIRGARGYLVFLEGGDGYWRLYRENGVFTPLSAFGYGSIFYLDSLDEHCVLRYLGLEYIRGGVATSIVGVPLLLLLLCGSRRLRRLVGGWT